MDVKVVAWYIDNRYVCLKECRERIISGNPIELISPKGVSIYA